MNSTIDLSFRYSESDFARGVRAHYASRLHVRFDMIMSIVLAIVGVYFLRAPRSYWFGITSIAVSASFALTLVVAFIIMPPLIFRRDPKLHDDYSLTFSSEGIHFRTVHIDSQLQWSIYSRALIDAHSYVLYYGSRSFTVIPKRAFQSAEQLQEFEQLLAQNVLHIIRKDR